MDMEKNDRSRYSIFIISDTYNDSYYNGSIVLLERDVLIEDNLVNAIVKTIKK